MKYVLEILLVLSIILTVAGCFAAGDKDPDGTESSTGEPLPSEEGGEFAVTDENLLSAVPTEDNYRVFYEIFTGSFSDSNGDGIGDLRGIIDRMDYLNDGDDSSGKSLGVEGIWLTPIFKSMSYHKYDINDYYTIDPSFGTEEDLKELIELCHQRNVKLILDLPLNHTGTLNPWFTSFTVAHRNGDAEDPYYDFYTYIGADETAPAGRSFTALSGTDIKYECNFSGGMPELNFDNEAVRQAALDVAKYYLDLGVDGFRFDAAKYIYYTDHEKTAQFWKWYIGELKAVKPDIYTVAEVWDDDGITDRYFPAVNCFNFTASQVDGLIAQTAQTGNVNRYTAYVQDYVEKVNAMNPDAMIIPFIANHDTDRAAGYLTVASGQMKMAANLYLLSSGSPFIYYGEEIGLRGSRGGANTDANRRLRMEWGDGDTVLDPEGADYAVERVYATVEQQLSDPNSLYNYYKELIMIRKANPAICRGTYVALQFTDTKLGGFTSTYEGTTVAVLHNTTRSTITVDLSQVTDIAFTQINACIGEGTASLDGTLLTLDSQTSVVLG
ncbi:MAG: hypothetical protein J1F60_10130 [Oscillospiraceae bacterium]|nr:hypothetical protein [Oscillospiraceae bacterium]